MRFAMLVLALSSAAPTTWSSASGCGGGGGGDEEATVTPEYADESTPGTRFAEIATLASHVGPCPTNGAQVEGCYNRVNPPAPSIRRSFVKAGIDATGTQPFDRENPSSGETFILPNHRSTVDGRLVTTGGPGLASFRPESLGYGFQATATNPLRGEQHGFYMSHMMDPRPGKSRIPAEWVSQIKGAPAGWDVCSADGPASTGARACSATLADAWGNETLAQGDCYDITPVWSWEMGGHWDIRSVPLTAFVPAGKALDAAEDNEPILFPRTAASYLGKHKDYSAFHTSACDTKYGPLWGNCDWSYARFAAEVAADCSSGASNQPWCKLLDDQKSASGNFTFFTAPGVSHAWNGKSGNTPNTHHAFLEPAITADGRLLFVHDYRQGILYSYADTACDASKWTTFKPLSMAFTDPAVNSRYGFAKFPIRRFDGSMVPAGETIPGGYPWVDRRGDNVMFPLAQNQKGAWRGIAEKTGAPWNHETVGTTNQPGVVTVGAWTKGKMVLLDNGLNATDWGSTDYYQRNDTFRLGLYRDQVARFRPQGISLLSSLENQFNHVEAMNPITPRDVVWMMSAATQRNAEVAFDEYMQSRVLIAAHMNAELGPDFFPELVAGNYESVAYAARNGFGRIIDSSKSLWQWYWQFTGAQVVLQNASTTVNPARLQLLGGAWINPIAEGGVQGRGVYLDGFNDHIKATNVPVVGDFYLGIWVDVRTPGWSAASKPSRKLFELAGGGDIEISNDQVTFRTAAASKAVAATIPAGIYTHVGVALRGDSPRLATVFINGTKAGDVALDALGSAFMLGSAATATLVVGGAGTGALPLGAWVDEFRLLQLSGSASAPDFLEEVCNQALGSLRRLPGGGATCEQMRFRQNDVLDAAGADKGLEYPLAAYTTRNCGSTVHGNAGSECMRAEALGLSQKHLVANNPRPDFSTVPFCVSCHNSAVSPIKGLLPAALAAGSQPSKLDPRRQPMQWARTMTGYAPSLNGAALSPYSSSGGGAATRSLDELFLGTDASKAPAKVKPPGLH